MKNIKLLNVVKNVITLSSDKGGYLCIRCRGNEPITNDKTIKLIRMYTYVEINKITKLDLDIKIVKEVDNFLNVYYDRYTGLYLKSKNFLKTLD